jgi:Fur family transcriptional regulator, ferric uptake regulator
VATIEFKITRINEMIHYKKRAFNTFLADKGLRSTSQRNIILDLFLITLWHVRVDELCLRIKATHPGIGNVLVYRTLKLFVEAGLAREVLLHDGQTRFEHVIVGEHHDHWSAPDVTLSLSSIR